MGKTIYSCSIHIEELLDVFLDDTSEMPVMEEANNGVMCYECQEQAIYKLSGSDVKAIWD